MKQACIAHGSYSLLPYTVYILCWGARLVIKDILSYYVNDNRKQNILDVLPLLSVTILPHTIQNLTLYGLLNEVYKIKLLFHLDKCDQEFVFESLQPLEAVLTLLVGTCMSW